MGRAALGVVQSGIGEAQIAVYGIAHFAGVGVVLAVVLPPANGAQGESAGCIQCPEAATRAAKANRCCPHASMDGIPAAWITEMLFPSWGG